MKITHSFVELIPANLDQGMLYISIRFRTASHLCMCGCGSKVVTPIRPERWSLSYDGESVSLSPSVGNWNLECKSHYWIVNDIVQWSESFSEDQIKSVKKEEAERIQVYYNKSSNLKKSFMQRIVAKLRELMRL